MGEHDEAVLVKAHLRRKGKRRGNPLDLIPILFVSAIIFVGFYFFYEWARAGGWVIIIGGSGGLCLIYLLIRFRKYVFQKRVWTASIPSAKSAGWQTIRSRDYPLWLIHRLYDLRFKQNARRGNYIINGKVWQYRIELNDPFITEPSATINGLKISKRKRNK